MGGGDDQNLICAWCSFVHDQPEAYCFCCGKSLSRVPVPPPSVPPQPPWHGRSALLWALVTVPLVFGALLVGLILGHGLGERGADGRLTEPTPTVVGTQRARPEPVVEPYFPTPSVRAEPSVGQDWYVAWPPEPDPAPYFAPAPSPSPSPSPPTYSVDAPVDVDAEIEKHRQAYRAEVERMRAEEERRYREELDRLALEQERQLLALSEREERARQEWEREQWARELERQREDQRRAQAERERLYREEQERQRRQREAGREAERNTLQRYVCGHCGAEIQRTKAQGSPFSSEGGPCEEGRNRHWWIRR